jgi:hypothetical protein
LRAFYGLLVGREVGLKYFGNFLLENVEKDEKTGEGFLLYLRSDFLLK